MPMSKKGNLYYTNEQYEIARYQSSALEYARSAGYALEKSGKYYKMKDHDSFVFGSNGMWFWNSHSMRGGAIEFITQIEHRSLVDAVLTLSGELNPQLTKEHAADEKHSAPYQKLATSEIKEPFVLPEKSSSYKRLFAYLCQSRKLDPDIVQQLVGQKRIYESKHPYGDREIHNVVFVSYDEQGTAVAAFQRGTATSSSFKGDVSGSDKEHYGWLMPGYPDTTSIVVFEAAIDAISHATLQKHSGLDYMESHRMALGGCTNFQPLLLYMKSHPHITSISLGFDNDEGGNNGINALCAALRDAGYTKDNGYSIYRVKSTYGKDFNEQLIRSLQAEDEVAQEHDTDEPVYEPD